MARALFRYVVKDELGSVLENAAINIYRPGTTTAVFGSMYAAETGGSPITNPRLSNDQGEVIVWLDTPQVVDVQVTSNTGQAHYPSTPSSLISFTTFTESSLQVSPGPSTTVAIGSTPSSLTVENHDTSRHTITVQGDNGDGKGTVEWFAVENSNPGPNDMDFRNVIMNIGAVDTGVQKFGAVTANFTSPTGSTGQYIRTWAPGVSNTNPSCFSVGVNGNVTLAVGGLSSTALAIKTAADAQSKMTIDETGVHNWGPGGSTATDTSLSRTAANTLTMAAGDTFRITGAAHGSLPAASGFAAGAQFYCTTDKQPIWSDGTSWYEADGTVH